MIATSGFLTALECTKFVFDGGYAPDPTGGAYSAFPDPLAGLRGPTSKRGEGRPVRARKEERKGASFPKFLDPPLVLAKSAFPITKFWS